MYENPFVLKLCDRTGAPLPRAHNGSSKMCIAQADRRKNTCCVYRSCFIMNILFPGKQKDGRSRDLFNKKLMPSILSISSTLNIHQYHSWHHSFVCLQRAALHSSLQNNRPNDPSCIGNYAFRLSSKLILLFSSRELSYLCLGETKGHHEYCIVGRF